jgi:hypothetical protein
MPSDISVRMDASRRLWPRPDLRVGDADRQAIVSELQRHYVEGRLNSDELGERVSQALAARTFADLAAVVHDLPPLAEAIAPGEPANEYEPWHPTSWVSPSIGLLVMIVGMVVLLAVFMMPGMRFAFFPWPLLIWGFFFFGRPSHRRRF